MKIIRAYKNTNTDKDVNIHNKQFRHEHLKRGDTVYRKKDGGYDNESMGTVQDILHSGYCTVMWPWNTNEPEVCKMDDLMTVKKYDAFYTPTNPIESEDDSYEEPETYQAIGVQSFDDDVYAAESDDYEEPEYLYFPESIFLNINNLEIEVYPYGEWDYIDDEFTFAQNKRSVDGNWYVMSYDINYPIENERHGIIGDAMFRDYVSVAEDFDQLLESIIPRFSGSYVLNGTAELLYDVSGTIYKDSDRTYTFEYDMADFDLIKSKKKFNVSITTQE